VIPQREPYRHVRWGDAFGYLTDRTDHPVDRDDLRSHLKYRWFAPDDPEAIDSLIDDAVSSGVLTEKKDGSLGYNGEFVTVSLDMGGEVRIDTDPR
jgi:hypothetical protein